MDRVGLKAFLKALDKAIESPVMCRVAEALQDGCVYSMNELIELIYIGKEPAFARDVIAVCIWKLRKRGMHITNEKGRGFYHRREAA